MRSDPINQTINPPSELSQKNLEAKIETGKRNQIHSKDPMHSVNNADEGMTHTGHLIPDVPFHPGPTYRPPPKPIRSNMPRSQESSQCSPSVEILIHFKKALFLKLSNDWTSHSFMNQKN